LVEHAAISAPHAQKLVKHWFLRAMVPVPLAASQHRPSLLNICHRRHITRCRMYVCPSLSLRVLCVLSSLKTNNRTQSQVSIWGFWYNHNCTLFIRGIISRVHNAQARNARQLTTEWQYRFELSWNNAINFHYCKPEVKLTLLIYRVAQKSKLLTQYNSLLFWATLYVCVVSVLLGQERKAIQSLNIVRRLHIALTSTAIICSSRDQDHHASQYLKSFAAGALPRRTHWGAHSSS